MRESLIQVKKENLRKLMIPLLLILLVLISFRFYTFNLSINMANWFVPFHVEEPSYVPIDSSLKYSNVMATDRIRMVYKNPNETLTVWATTDIGWNVVSNWEEKINLSDEVSGYYNEHGNVKMVSWRKGEVEYSIDYTGKALFKDDLIKVANSIK